MGLSQSSASNNNTTVIADSQDIYKTPTKSNKTPFHFRTPKSNAREQTPNRNSPARSHKTIFHSKANTEPPMSPLTARSINNTIKPVVEEWRWLPVDDQPTCSPSDFQMSGECLGEGSFGKVMLATYIPTGAKVAVKIFDKQAIPENLKHYVIAEPKALRQLEHHNIIKMYLAHEDQQQIYLYMQYIDGGDLHTYVEQRGNLSERRAFKLFYQIVHAVAYCHRHNVCHRDLKLENVMLMKSQQRAILIDFGFAGFIPNTNHQFKDHPGSVCYAAPELVMGKDYDGPTADIYSLGVLLYVMVMGTYPFYSEDRRILYHQIVNCNPSFDPKLSASLVDLLIKMLSKNPNDRIRMDAVLNHAWIKSFLAEESVSGSAVFSPVFTPIKTGTSKLMDTVERASPVKPRRLF